MSTVQELLDANEKYAQVFGEKARLAMPPARHFAILTCMDARLDPAKYAGLREGDAHVIRNAGGRVSDDAIRSLVISHKLLGTNEWFVVHHTDCGMETFTGEVTQVDPGLYTSGNTSVVRAIVKLDSTNDDIHLPIGTAAAVDVIGGRTENAVLVPIEALHQADGKYTVFVMENGTPRLRLVEVGLQDITYVEIKSGIEAGEIVTTGIVETQ